MTRPFDLLSTVLDPGVALLEASAGTGKTYTLAGLFFRLVTEHDLAPSQILVSTYTEAATAELRDRIRTLLRSAWLAAETGDSDDEFVRTWFASERVPREVARERLARALRNFDEAAIHTIHGFCRRMLQDRAFESGLVFNAELITDQEPLLRELADDFWRAHFHTGEPAITALALAEGIEPSGLARLLGQVVSHPLLRVLPDADSLAATGAEIARIFEELRDRWPQWRGEVETHLFQKGNWAKPASARDWKAPLDLAGQCIADSAAPVASYKALGAFTREKLAKGARLHHVPPPHPFFDLCGNIQVARHDLRAGIGTKFLAWARGELPRRKAQRNVITFDDLLTRLHGALHSESGDALVKLIRGRFRAALIDEFQDTDSIQEAIFRQLFRDGTSWLFLIGDPKQAIYGFRGADVFTYLSAAVGAPCFQLGTNYRSTTQLIAGVNAIFSEGPKPFVIDEIQFTPVKASGRADERALHVSSPPPPLQLMLWQEDPKPAKPAGDLPPEIPSAKASVRANRKEPKSVSVPVPPFQFWVWQEDKPISVRAAEELLPQVVAAEAARILSGNTRSNGKPLLPSNLAVLVTTNRQARLIQAALIQTGIPSVLLTDESVYKSFEAQELHTLLAALAEPSRESHLRAALATETLGLSADAIESLQRDELAWERRLLQFHLYHELWRDRGFIQMFRHLLREENIRTQLLQYGDGERRLTNFLHLGELLHHAAMERRLGPGALLSWFAGQRGAGRPAGDNHELRLERDEAALQIATIHKSKGLEYDVVFCPFSWGSAELRNAQSVFFHEETESRPLVLDLGSEQFDEHKTAATRERLAEQTRLLYVALTRARLHTYFAWGQFNDSRLSAANWVLHPTHASDDAPTMMANFGALSGEARRTELNALAARFPRAISVVDLPGEKAAPYLASKPESEAPSARSFQGRITHDWRISSFSSLTIERDAETPDHDPQTQAPAPVEEVIEAKGIHTFPRGKKAGTCLHEIFERLDFSHPDEIRETVKSKLAAFDFGKPEWSNSVIECVQNTLAAKLEPGFTLRGVESKSCLVELEFYLPVNQLTADELLHRLGPDAAAGLRFESRRGMLKGFIDLVVMHEGRFSIVDWKSNHLGPHSASYGQEALNSAMRQHHYGLQYHLYTLALHRYLALRLPDYDYDTHFGGVFYIFLRGVDPLHDDRGIFRARPSRETIENLSMYLAGGL